MDSRLRHRSEQLYDNMSPDYKLYIHLNDVTDLEELSARAAEYELIEKQPPPSKLETPTRRNGLEEGIPPFQEGDKF